MSGVGAFMAGGGGAAPLSILISPDYSYTSRTGAGAISSGTVTGTALGGTSPYTYAWAYVSGNSYTISSAATASTQFSTSLSGGFYKSGTYRCTVTDNLGVTAYADVGVDFESF